MALTTIQGSHEVLNETYSGGPTVLYTGWPWVWICGRLASAKQQEGMSHPRDDWVVTEQEVEILRFGKWTLFHFGRSMLWMRGKLTSSPSSPQLTSSTDTFEKHSITLRWNVLINSECRPILFKTIYSCFSQSCVILHYLIKNILLSDLLIFSCFKILLCQNKSRNNWGECTHVTTDVSFTIL